MFDKRITLGEKNRAGGGLKSARVRKAPGGMRLLMLLFLLGWMAACARLPEYARPRFHDPGDAAVRREGFGLRVLTIEDFQADALPAKYSPYDQHINAHSCISIRPAAESKVRITRSVYGGKLFYVGSLPRIRFEAVFVPACSWWNPKVSGNRKAYVLQHEQIHFALTELAARRLTRDAREELQAYLSIHDSYRAVREELGTKLRDMAHAAMESSFAEHTDFDEETSLYHDPRAQQWWLEEVTERLAEEER